MAKFHVNMFTGVIGVCEAEEGNCPVSDRDNHFDNKADAVPASEKKLAELHGGTLKKHGKKVVSESFGNIPFTDDEFKRAIDFNVQARAGRLEDDLVYEAIQIEEDNAYSNDPSEFNTVEVILNKGEVSYYLTLASEKLLKDKPELLDEAFATGYPFVNNRQLAAAVVASDVVALLDKKGSLSQEEAFQSIKEKLGEDKHNLILEKAYYEIEKSGGVDRSMDLSLDLVDDSTSRYSKSYEACPPTKQLRQLQEDLGK